MFMKRKYLKKKTNNVGIDWSVACFRAELEEAFTLFDRVGDGQIDAQVKKKTNKQTNKQTKITSGIWAD